MLCIMLCKKILREIKKMIAGAQEQKFPFWISEWGMGSVKTVRNCLLSKIDRKLLQAYTQKCQQNRYSNSVFRIGKFIGLKYLISNNLFEG